MMKPTILCSILALTLLACSGGADDEATSEATGELGARAFRAHSTGYYPDSSALEGGFVDRLGKPLHTVQQFVAGRAPYVSVAMDSSAFPYGTKLRIPFMDAKYGRAIEFRVVDTGGAFRGRGTSRIDICVANHSASLDASVNRMLDVEVGGPGGATTTPPAAPTAATTGGTTTGGGAACSNDGACNPGSDGSGKICVSGACTAGCRADYHCPGSTTCSTGQCR